MGAEILHRKIGPGQGFDLNRGLIAPQIGIVRAGELRNDRLILEGLNIAAGKKLEGNADRLRVTACFDQRGDRAIAHMDIEKFIHIRDPNPIGILNDILFLGVLQRFHLIVAPLSRIGQVLHNSFRCQGVQKFVSRIGAII